MRHLWLLTFLMLLAFPREGSARKLCPINRRLSYKNRCLCPGGTIKQWRKSKKTFKCVRRQPTPKKICPVGVRLKRNQKCLCPSGTKKVGLDRSYTKCVRTKPTKRCPPYKSLCRSGPKKGQCYYTSCPPGYRFIAYRCRCCTACIKTRKKR